MSVLSVRRLSNNLFHAKPNTIADKVDEDDNFAAAFSQEFSQQKQNRDKHAMLFNRIKELNSVQDELIGAPNLTTFSKYKQEVRTLARDIMDKAVKIYRFEDRRKREYEVVKVLDDKLHALWQQLAQPSTILGASLRTMGEIRGILLEELR